MTWFEAYLFTDKDKEIVHVDMQCDMLIDSTHAHVVFIACNCDECSLFELILLYVSNLPQVWLYVLHVWFRHAGVHHPVHCVCPDLNHP